MEGGISRATAAKNLMISFYKSVDKFLIKDLQSFTPIDSATLSSALLIHYSYVSLGLTCCVSYVGTHSHGNNTKARKRGNGLPVTSQSK
ncbi:hypothetical protein ATANTOWER_023977 [Ataeniobius toweri]|uniref:Uncharacterized protein n=1 Tax=Ataeniobius toweri TaxID=208326 RepID=A0ABU7BRA2_9TELE|nr:hypothetical protein [Ataeniobius toweri]